MLQNSHLTFSIGRIKMLTLENIPSFIQYFLDTISYIIYFCKDFAVNKRINVPPGPTGYPFVGNLFQIGSNPKETFTKWHNQYGDVYSLRLGKWPCVVLNGHNAVYEALMKKKDAFADRPPFDSFKEYAGGLSISFQTFSKKYSKHRRIACKSLTNVLFNRSYQLDEIICREIEALLVNMKEFEADDTWFDPQSVVTKTIGSILYSVCFGYEKQLKDDGTYMELILGANPTTDLFAIGNHPDLFPLLRYLSGHKLQQGHSSRMSNFVKANENKIHEHITKINDNSYINPTNVMDCLIEMSKNLSVEDKDVPSIQQILASTIEFISAGVDTSSSTLLWLLLYMAKYPDVQDKVYQEIARTRYDLNDNNNIIRDKSKLPYTEACIWEVMRLNTIVPFALPHYSLYDSTVQDYFIKKGTLVFVNLQSVCRDPSKWANPDNFKPERFLLILEDRSLAVDRKKVEYFLPFSTGRRRCIGENLGKLQVFSVFTAIIGKYKLSASSTCSLESQFGDVQKPQSFKLKLQKRG